MKTRYRGATRLARTLIATAVAGALLAACAAAPVVPKGAAEARSKLTQLQADPELVNRAPVAAKEADLAVSLAEQPQRDTELAAHRVFMANAKVNIARAQAEMRLSEDQRAGLAEQRERSRLDARTHEADAAAKQALVARAESAEMKVEASQAKTDAVAANAAAANSAAAAASSAEESAELQRQIDTLQAKVTERGLVLTLGDVLFTSGQADLKPSATANLDKLTSFLNRYPERTAVIEGYTDSLGSDEYNLSLSQRRADSVRSYLMSQGVTATRLTASGKGESAPLEENSTASGRQQNRRVAIIIAETPPVASRQ